MTIIFRKLNGNDFNLVGTPQDFDGVQETINRNGYAWIRDIATRNGPRVMRPVNALDIGIVDGQPKVIATIGKGEPTPQAIVTPCSLDTPDLDDDGPVRKLILDDDEPAQASPDLDDDGPVRKLILDDDEPAQANVNPIVSNIGEHSDLERTRKYGKSEKGLRIGGAIGWAEGDTIARFTQATGYDETSKLGKVDETATAPRTCKLARDAAGMGDLRYGLRPVAFGSNPDAGEEQTWTMVPRAKGEGDKGDRRTGACLTQAVFREDTGQPVSFRTVSNRYGLSQPEDIEQVIDAVLSQYGVGIERIGLWDNGARYWGQTEPLMSFRSPSGPVNTRMTWMAGYDSSIGKVFAFSPTVAACRNVINGILSGAKHRWSFKSTKNVNKRLETLARGLESLRERQEDIESYLFGLGSKSITDRDLDGLIALTLPRDSETGSLSSRAISKAEAIRKAWTDSPGASPGSLWGAVQAVTFYGTHEFPSRAATREEAVFTGTPGRWMDETLNRINRWYETGSPAGDEDEDQVFQTVRTLGFAGLATN